MARRVVQYVYVPPVPVAHLCYPHPFQVARQGGLRQAESALAQQLQQTALRVDCTARNEFLYLLDSCRLVFHSVI